VTKVAKTMRLAQQVNGSVRGWTRRSFSVVVLLIVGLAAGPASAFLFTESWEGHASPSSVYSANGWSQGSPSGGGGKLQVTDVGTNPAPGMTGNYAFTTIDTGTDGSSVNDAGIGGGMDPSGTYTLKWTHHHLDQTSGLDFGFRTTSGLWDGPYVTLNGQFNGNSGQVYSQRPFEGSDNVGWPGDDTTTTYEILVTSSRFELSRNGGEISGGSMTSDFMQTINGIFIWHDTSNTRNSGYIDNITLALEPVFVPGDANGDGIVDVADLGVLGANFNQSDMTFADGDFNDDSLVDVADLGILGANWTASQTTGNASALVPEPTTLSLLAMSVLVVGRRRRG